MAKSVFKLHLKFLMYEFCPVLTNLLLHLLHDTLVNAMALIVYQYTAVTGGNRGLVVRK